jgi:hypothetical protein
VTGAQEGVGVARAALEYFLDQYAATPTKWAQVRVEVANRSLVAAETNLTNKAKREKTDV